MTDEGSGPPIKDSLAHQEATAVANRNLDEATRVAEFRWRRLFQNTVNSLMLGVALLVGLGWMAGFVVAGLNLILPERQQWMSDAHQHELYAWLGSGALTGFATNYFKSRT